MDGIASEEPVLQHIEALVAEEHALRARAALDEAQSKRLRAVQIELDQCWDLLRQQRAAREAGRDQANARVRAPEIVERYTG